MKSNQLKIVKRIILFTLALTLTNCQVEDNIAEQPQSTIKTVNINEAKTFLKQSLNNTSAKSIGSEKGNLELDKIVQEKINGSDQLLTVIPVLTNDKEEYSRILMSRINGVLRVIVFSMYSDKDIVTEHFSGKIMIRNLNGDFLNGFRVENGIYVTQYQIQKTTNNSTKREGGEETPSNAEKLTGVTIIHNYRRPNAATPWLYLYNDLDDSRGDFGNYSWDSGNGGGGESSSSNSPAEVPPSCESFNFIPDGSLWQVAMVRNINFKVLGVSPSGVQILHVLSYPQAVYFGTPTNVKVGNTNITSGIAANTSARVLQQSMQEVVDKYGGTNVSDLVLDQYFRERLMHNYPLYVPGGRVNFNSTSNVPATNYKTNFFTAGDCN